MREDFYSKSPQDTKKLAGDIVDLILKNNDNKDKNKAHLIFLKGNLGAGKTTFVKGVLEHFGVDVERGISPTFVILKRYDVNNYIIKYIYHIDAYRVKSFDDLKKLNIGDIFNNNENLILIEWPENIKELKDNGVVTIKFDYGEGINERIIKFNL